MGKRLVIKTILICFGVFLIINSVLFSYVFKKYPLDLEKHVTTVTAAVDIDEGTIIEQKHLKIKEVQQSASNSVVVADASQVLGKKCTEKIIRGDYIRTNCLVERKDWFQDDERIIVLPMSMEERLANLIQKGSYIDIRLKRDASDAIERVLDKVKVQDVLDETGTPLSSKSAINSKTFYMKLILDKDERQKVYTAKNTGKLIYELYCDETQKSEG